MSEVKCMTNKKLGIIVSLVFIIGCFVGCAGGGSKEGTGNTTTQNTVSNTPTTSTEEVQKEIPKATKTVSLGAGEYIVGKDLPPGRYKATGSSNFQVYASSDKSGLKVNTILGGGTVGRGDYTFWAEDGNLVETAAKVKLIPVK